MDFRILPTYNLKEYSTPKQTAKEIFSENLKGKTTLLGFTETIHKSVIQIQNTIRENPNYPTYKQDYLFEVISELYKI